MLLKMPRTRRARISFVMKVRSTIVDAMYPAISVIVVMARPPFSGLAVGQLCSGRRLITPAGIAEMSLAVDLVSLVSRPPGANSGATGRRVMAGETVR